MLLDLSPVTNCHTFSDPFPPSSVTYFMDGPTILVNQPSKLYDVWVEKAVVFPCSLLVTAFMLNVLQFF